MNSKYEINNNENRLNLKTLVVHRLTNAKFMICVNLYIAWDYEKSSVH